MYFCNLKFIWTNDTLYLKQTAHITVTAIVLSFFIACVKTYGQDTSKGITLDEVVSVLSLKSASAQIEKLNYQNEILQFENLNQT